MITLDALHTTPATLITRRRGADHVFPVKRNASETFDILDGIDQETDASGRFKQEFDKARGRLEQRSRRVLTPLEGLINYPGRRSASGAASGNDCTGTSSPRSMRNTRRQRNCCGRGP